MSTNKTDSELVAFIIVPPGMEELAKHELEVKFKKEVPISCCTKGGITINSNLIEIRLMNLYLKIPTRILIRVDEFKCKDLPKLYNKIRKIDWGLWFAGNIPKIKSSSSKSRVFDSRKIENSIIDGIKRRYVERPPKKKIVISGEEHNKAPIFLFVRFENDLCTLSIDSSGDRLSLRGSKYATTIATIRENLAAGLIYSISRQLKNFNMTLIDPMCGSGTFLFEAQNFYKQSSGRTFSIDHIIKQLHLENLTEHEEDNPIFSAYQGFDIDQTAINAAKTNAASYKTSEIKFDIADLFEDSNLEEKNCCVVVNPPYGLRIKIDSKPSIYFNRIIETIQKKYQPIFFGIIIPKNIGIASLPAAKKFQLIEKIDFKNSNIPVTWYLFQKL